MMPAATSCSLYSPIARSSSADGIRPASVASLAFTSTITFITALPIQARRGPFHPATVGGGRNRHRRCRWIHHARTTRSNPSDHAMHACSRPGVAGPVPPEGWRMEIQRLRLSGGGTIAYRSAGDPARPALLLLHGTPNSSRMFLGVMPRLATAAHVIAPDLPGHGDSDPLPSATFSGMAEAVGELLENLGIGPRYIHLHDWGAPVGL